MCVIILLLLTLLTFYYYYLVSLLENFLSATLPSSSPSLAAIRRASSGLLFPENILILGITKRRRGTKRGREEREREREEVTPQTRVSSLSNNYQLKITIVIKKGNL